MDFFIDHIETLLIILINLIILIGSYFKIRAKVDQSSAEIKALRSMIHEEISDVEKTRLRNVAALREIYDAKIHDSKQYAKGLYELRESELRELSKRIETIELKFDKQSEIINGKFEELIKSNAAIMAVVKINGK